MANPLLTIAALADRAGSRPAVDLAGQTRLRRLGFTSAGAAALNTFRVAAMRRELLSPKNRQRALHDALAAAPDAAHAAAARIELEAVADALRQGSRATVQEFALIKRELTFPLSEVATPVHLWHGARDRNAPIAFARRLARELPDATLHVRESSGHDVGVDCSGEVMSVLASCVKESPAGPGPRRPAGRGSLPWRSWSGSSPARLPIRVCARTPRW
jgi:pimeloyl-ACP methyl ester carboxylesterase